MADATESELNRDKHQRLATNKCLDAIYRNGKRKFLPKMATGTCKTRVAVMVMQQILNRRSTAKFLFLVRSQALYNRVIAVFSENPHFVIRDLVDTSIVDVDHSLPYDGDWNLTVAVYNSAVTAFEESNLTNGEFDLVFADEAHHIRMNPTRMIQRAYLGKRSDEL